MKYSNLIPINSSKLEKLLSKHGSLYDISEELHLSRPALRNAIKRGSLSPSWTETIRLKYGIEYEDYKPEEPKPEPKEEPKPVPETVITDKYEQHLKAILFQLANVNNNLVALAKIIAKIDEDIKVWECDD